MAARPLDPVGSRNLRLLTQAWAERRVVELTYDTSTYDPARQPRSARVRPYLIEPSAATHALYLIGFDETRGGLRTFKLERIRTLALTSVQFEPPPDGEIEAALDRAWGIVADQPVVGGRPALRSLGRAARGRDDLAPDAGGARSTPTAR